MQGVLKRPADKANLNETIGYLARKDAFERSSARTVGLQEEAEDLLFLCPSSLCSSGA
jgi:hypothetical protein